jgi:hypothetical protein
VAGAAPTIVATTVPLDWDTETLTTLLWLASGAVRADIRAVLAAVPRHQQQAHADPVREALMVALASPGTPSNDRAKALANSISALHLQLLEPADRNMATWLATFTEDPVAATPPGMQLAC